MYKTPVSDYHQVADQNKDNAKSDNHYEVQSQVNRKSRQEQRKRLHKSTSGGYYWRNNGSDKGLTRKILIVLLEINEITRPQYVYN